MNRRELVEMMDQVAGEIITRGDYIQVLKWFRRISVATGNGFKIAVLEDELKYLCSMLFSVNEEDNIHRVLKG